MAVNIDALTAEVANNSTVTGSVVTLLQKLAAEIAAIPPSTDPTTQAALDALTATLTSNDATIAAAVTANTPAATAAMSASTPARLCARSSCSAEGRGLRDPLHGVRGR